MQSVNKTSEQELLVDQYINFAEKLASKIIRQHNLPYYFREDLHAAAKLGLVEAVNKFEPRLGVPFSSYAYYRIRGSIYDCLRTNGNLPKRIYQRLKILEVQNNDHFNLAQAKNSSSKNETNERLAKVLEILSNSLMIEQLGRVVRKPPKILSQEYAEETRKRELHLELKEIVRRLPEKESFIIENYYFNDLSFTEISKLMGGTSKSWVSRLHTQGIKKIKMAWIKQDKAVKFAYGEGE